MLPGMLSNQFPALLTGGGSNGGGGQAEVPGGQGSGGNPSEGANVVVWRGNIRIQWDCNEIIVPAVAHALRVPCFSRLIDAATWPSDLICDAAQLTELHHYFALMTEARAQWLAQLVPIDENSTANAALQRLLRVMTNRGRAIEIECSTSAFIPPVGNLYLWATEQLGLVAVYRPTPVPESHVYNIFGAPGAGGPLPPGVPPQFPTPRPCGPGIWTGFLQVRLRDRAENLYVSACQSIMSRDFGILDTTLWPFNIWCSLSNMHVASPMLESMHENSNQWMVRFVPATSSDSHTPNALRSFAVYMQARRLMFEISCGTLNGDELILCMFGVVHASYGNSVVGGFRMSSSPHTAISKPMSSQTRTDRYLNGNA